MTIWRLLHILGPADAKSKQSVGAFRRKYDFVKVDQVFKADWSYIFYILHELYEDIADLSMYMSRIFFPTLPAMRAATCI